MLRSVLLIACLACLCSFVQAYPTGAGDCYADSSTVSEAGSSMGSTADNTLGFALHAPSTLLAGQRYNINITHSSNAAFAGFLVYADGGDDATVRHGHWQAGSSTSEPTSNSVVNPIRSCPSGAALDSLLTHASPISKQTPFTMSYTADSTTGQVTFRAIVVDSSKNMQLLTPVSVAVVAAASESVGPSTSVSVSSTTGVSVSTAETRVTSATAVQNDSSAAILTFSSTASLNTNTSSTASQSDSTTTSVNGTDTVSGSSTSTGSIVASISTTTGSSAALSVTAMLAALMGIATLTLQLVAL